MSQVRSTVSGFSAAGWDDPASAAERSRDACARLEAGNILFFESTPFPFPAEDRAFLLDQKQSAFKGHKNISYRPKTDVLRGAAGGDPAVERRLHEVMRRFSQRTTEFLTRFLAPYAGHWSLDFATFRPVEEKGRDLPLHKRNDLIHVDAFPTRPTRGARILRVFTNINPATPRVWATTAGFDTLAKTFGGEAGLPKFAASAGSPVHKAMHKLTPLFRAVGVKGTDRSAYDRFMLRFHDYLKENNDYQQKWEKIVVEFPPGSTWMCFTDQVPHAALSGQYALEQTYIIPLEAMVTPERSPLRVLEEICGKPLVN